MKKVLITAALLALTASAASAQISLNWQQCIQQNAALGNRNDACYVCPLPVDNKLVSSFLSPVTTGNYVGVTTIIDVNFTGGTIPDWWRFDAAGCRANALTLTLYSGTATLCPDGMAGANLNGPSIVLFNGWKGPNTIRIVSDNSRDNVFSLNSGSAYVAQEHHITHNKTVVDCDASPTPDNTPVCLGCATGATLALNEVQLYTNLPAPNDKFILTSPNIRNYALLNNGAGVPTPTQSKSWGAVKALYR